METEEFGTTLGQLQTDAKTVRQNFSKQRDEIMKSKDLSPEGRTRKLSEIKAEADTKIGEKKSSYFQTVNQYDARIVEDLFVEKNANKKADYRSALDTVAKAESKQDLIKALERSRTLQDDSLVKAISYTAFERKLYDVARDALKTDAQKEMFDELIALRNITGQQKLQISMAFAKV